MNDEIKLERNGTRGRYVLAGDGDEAELTFMEPQPGHLTVDHTYVPRSQRGRGTAARLVGRLIEDARAGGVKITPLCSYVASEFRRHPEWGDLLKR